MILSLLLNHTSDLKTFSDVNNLNILTEMILATFKGTFSKLVDSLSLIKTTFNLLLYSPNPSCLFMVVHQQHSFCLTFCTHTVETLIFKKYLLKQNGGFDVFL